jgi:hypothetical protein
VKQSGDDYSAVSDVPDRPRNTMVQKRAFFGNGRKEVQIVSVFEKCYRA